MKNGPTRRLFATQTVINEAANQNEEEFGEDRILKMISDAADATPAELCKRIMNEVTEFASDEARPTTAH